MIMILIFLLKDLYKSDLIYDIKIIKEDNNFYFSITLKIN